MNTNDLSFCEPAQAAPLAKWCLRVLTDKGQKFGGGIDTPSLCGRVQPPMGWDLAILVSLKHPSICPQCLEHLKGK